VRNVRVAWRSLGTMAVGTASLVCALASCLNLTGDRAVFPPDAEAGAEAQAPVDGTTEAATVDSGRDEDTSVQGKAVDSPNVDNADALGDVVAEQTGPADVASDLDVTDADVTEADVADADVADADVADADVADAHVADVSVPRDNSEDADASADREPEEGAGPPSDFYVDPNAPDDGAMFRTITAALVAANSSSATNRTIHVAAGTYSVGSGESFPIVVRGVSLMGSGASTLIVGIGAFNGVQAPSILGDNGLPISPSPVTASLVLGDKAGTTRVAHLRVESPSAAAPGSEGMICERGSTAAAGVTIPNTWIDDVTVDGFELALRLTYSLAPDPQGCSAAVTSSTFTNGSFGIFADGWARPDGTVLQRVSAQIGDGTPTGGNVFRGFAIPAGPAQFLGAGMMTRDAVTGLIVRSNHFSKSDIGIYAAQTSGSPGDRFDVEQNDFSLLTNVGIILQGPVTVDPLAGNTIHDITTAGTPQCYPGIGLIVQASGPTGFPTVRARGNSMFGNDCGVQIRTYTSYALDTLPDFGTAMDPGGNTFRCNSWAPAPTCCTRCVGGCTGCVGGGDVLVDTPGKTPPLPFEGNVWDHAPPLVSPQGDDVVLYSGPSVDFAKASAASTPACPAAHTP
jgi:Protein of unknown function (DUF1565)